jgi:hypothetical protein
MMQSYKVLIQWVPILKDLSEQGDTESLEIIYKNVNFYLVTTGTFLIPHFPVTQGSRHGEGRRHKPSQNCCCRLGH